MGAKSKKQEANSAFSAHAFSLARALGIKTALILADDPRSFELVGEDRTLERVIWMGRDLSDSCLERPEDRVLPIPEAKLTRTSQISIGLYSSTLRGYVELSETVLCISGIAGSGRLDMLLVTQPNRDFPWLRQEDLDRTRSMVAPREFGRLLDLALRFAAEGREGKPIGTIFVLGDFEQLEPHLRQLILNPCAGHARRSRSIHNPDLTESLREFCALDGAIIVSRKGVVESAGTYLDAPARTVRMRHGLGARHVAAAAITKVTDAISFVISESSGTVLLFDNGKPILELERPA